MIKAKFRLISIEPTSDGAGSIVKLEAVTAERAENKEWSKWTPSGKLEMLITNPGALCNFHPDGDLSGEVYLTLSQA